jgi:hypothetical protein
VKSTGSTDTLVSRMNSCESTYLRQRGLAANFSSLYEGPETIADHILALYSAKLLAYTKHDPEKLVIDLEKITPGGQTGKEGAIFIHTSKAGESVTVGPGATVEKR